MKIPPPLPDDELNENSLWDPRARPKDPLVAWLEQKVAPRRHRDPGLRRARGMSDWLLAAALAAAAAIVLWLWLGHRPAEVRARAQHEPVAAPRAPAELPPVAAEPAFQEPANEAGTSAGTR
jgi:hypothetical protein